MGYRATIIFENGIEGKGREWSPTIYLHWTGSPEYVYAFLAELDRRKVRPGFPTQEAAVFLHIAQDCRDWTKEGAGNMSVYVYPGMKTFTSKNLKVEAAMADDYGLYLVRRHGDGAIFDRGTSVRRFWSDGTEMEPASVEEERLLARESITATTVDAAFRGLRPKVSDRI